MATGQNNKNDFLRFSAYSLKDLITRKLSEDSRFTDQIFEGSNLAIIIDLCAYLYQCLVYQLNTAASESMFQDTQLFENITRLVSLLGYQAKGCTPSAIQTYITYSDGDPATVKILPYTRFKLPLVDSRGNQICFSTTLQNTVDDEYVVDTAGKGQPLKVTFRNGRYKMYSQIFTASGLGNEAFTLEGLKSDSFAGSPSYVAQNYIDVYVDTGVDAAPYQKWNFDVNGIFTKSRNIDQLTIENSFYGTASAGGEDQVYTVYLNQNKQYELRFGDGIIGAKLNSGDRVIVMYLDTNGPDGKVDISDIDFNTIHLEHSASMFGMTDNVYRHMFGTKRDQGLSPIVDSDVITSDRVKCKIQSAVQAATEFKPEESVEEIRQNAPNWFKTGNRLITKADYEYFVKTNIDVMNNVFSTTPIADVKCMNNIEYTTTFYKWLYLQGRINHPSHDSRHYFDKSFWNRTDYAYVDPADANNTYLWIKTKNSDISEFVDEYDVGTVEEGLNTKLKPIKTMTTEIKVVKPVYVNFDICAHPIATDNDLRHFRETYLNSSVDKFDPKCESYVEVTLDDNALYANTMVQTDICNIIQNAFNINVCQFGKAVQYEQMLKDIYAITGVKRIRTIYAEGGINGKVVSAVDGLSFASWSPLLNDIWNRDPAVGIDLMVSTSVRALESFQFPRFIGRDKLRDRIVLVKKTMTALNTVLV